MQDRVFLLKARAEMSPRDKYLYHQIHPLKLLTDVASGFGSLYPLWHHHLVLALVVMLVPPPLVSLLLMRFAELEPYRTIGPGQVCRAFHVTCDGNDSSDWNDCRGIRRLVPVTLDYRRRLRPGLVRLAARDIA